MIRAIVAIPVFLAHHALGQLLDRLVGPEEEPTQPLTARHPNLPATPPEPFLGYDRGSHPYGSILDD